MERLVRALEQASRDAVAVKAEAVRERLAAVFGEGFVERAGQDVRVRARGIGRRRLSDPSLRFFRETAR